jgi:epoxyqueuosine reductase
MISGSEFKTMLLHLAEEEGFPCSRILGSLPPVKSGDHCNEPYPAEARSALIVFLPYDCDGGPGVIAPFARSNYYQEAVARLKHISTVVRQKTGFTKGDLRIFCNSRFPEKQMAWCAGLGTLGRNSLLITPEYGSLGIIAGMFIPLDLPGDLPLERNPYDSCGTCSQCLEACPAGAIRAKGGLERSLCFQYLSTESKVLSPEVTAQWNLLYGCQICQDRCPKNRKKPQGTSLERGFLGAEPDLRFILTASDEELKAFRKGTVLGQSWIDSVLLRRNALICLWQRSNVKERKSLVASYLEHKDNILSETARCLIDLYPIRYIMTEETILFIKGKRKELSLSQEDLADRAGVGLRFVRDLEQGKETLRMDKVNQVLELFGQKLVPGPVTRVNEL